MFETIYQFFYLKFLLKKIKNVDTLFHCWYFLLKTTYLATTGHHIRPILGRYAQIIAFDSQLTMVPESFQVVFEFVFYKILFVIFKFFKLFILPNYENEQVKKIVKRKWISKFNFKNLLASLCRCNYLLTWKYIPML